MYKYHSSLNLRAKLWIVDDQVGFTINSKTKIDQHPKFLPKIHETIMLVTVITKHFQS